MTEENIKRLMNELKEAVQNGKIDVLEIYSDSMQYVDIAKIQNAENVTAEEIALAFAIGGFFVGVEYALRNVEGKEE